MRRLILSLSLTGILVAALAPSVSAVLPGDEPATAITVGTGTATFDSTDMTESASDPAACDPFPGPLFNTMWFAYRAARDGITNVDVNSFVSEDGSTDYLAVLLVYRVDGTSRTLVMCSAYPANVAFPAEAGTTYLILVAGLSTEATEEPELSDRGGTFDLTITTIKGRVQKDQFRSADSYVDDESCSQPMTVAWDDKIIDKLYYDKTGPVMFTSHVNGRSTFTAPGGKVVTFRYAQKFVDYFDGTGAYIGLAQKVIVDGRAVLVDVGRLVFDFETGEVIFEAGHHPQWYDGVDICGLLGI